MLFTQFAARRFAFRRALHAPQHKALLSLVLIAALLAGCIAPASQAAVAQPRLHASAHNQRAPVSAPGRIIEQQRAALLPAHSGAHMAVVLPTVTPTRTPAQTPAQFATATPTRVTTQAPTRLPTHVATHTPTATATLAPISEHSGGPTPPLAPLRISAAIASLTSAPAAPPAFGALPATFNGTVPPAEGIQYGGSAPPLPDVEAPAGLAATWDETENFLLLGTDRTPRDSAWRTDSIVIAGLDRANKRAVLFSVPRDLYLQIPGYGWGRINQIDYIGEQRGTGNGPQLLGEVIEETLGIPIHHWARLHMDGFVGIIDALGGVTITLEEDFYEPIMRTGDEFVRDFHLPAGQNQLDGATAYLFVRLRRAGTDIGRSARQRAVIWAIRDKLLTTDTLTRLPELYSTFQESVATDLSILDLVGLAQVALTLDTDNVHSGALTTRELQNHVTSSGAQVLIMPDPLAVRAAIEGVWSSGAPLAADSFLGGGSPTLVTPTPTPVPTVPPAQEGEEANGETPVVNVPETATEVPTDIPTAAPSATPTPLPEDAPVLLPTVTPAAGT